jgi:hypothetical protein
MNNIVIFTQDVPGEREWIQTQFPDYENLESEFSGKWTKPWFSQDQKTIWEIPPDSDLDVSQIPCTKYKSFYQQDTEFISSRWVESNQVLLNNINFFSSPRAAKAQVLHFARCGTVFLESILYKVCKYDKDRGWNKLDPTSDHAFLGGENKDLYAIVNQSKPDIFLCYRNNWWAWATSVLISKKFDYYHYNDNINWKELTPFSVTNQDLEILSQEARANWQSLCHFRTCFPNLNFYIFEFSDLIKHSNLTDHRQINYDKKALISNYSEMQSLFEKTYLPSFQVWEKNCIAHLTSMNCEVIRDFDKFIR